MGEAQTLHFYDVGIFEPVTKPHNQLFLILETPGYLKIIKKIPGTLLRSIIFCKSRDLKIHILSIFEKTGTEK